MIRTLTIAIALVSIIPFVSVAEEAPKMAIELASPAFENGQPIPKKYTADGEDVSPALEWSNVPEGTRNWRSSATTPTRRLPSLGSTG